MTAVTSVTGSGRFEEGARSLDRSGDLLGGEASVSPHLLQPNTLYSTTQPENRLIYGVHRKIPP